MPYKLRFFADFCLALTASQTLIRGSLNLYLEQTSLDRYAVFGNPISQSKSPWIHRHFAEQVGQNLEYGAQLVEVGGFSDAADRFFKAGGKGLNITTPFKDDAYAYANTLSARARRAGAVNTLAIQEEAIVLGDTTDGVGLIRDITENLGWNIENSKVLILGAGGAVRGILEPLLGENPESVTVANRTASKAEALAKGFADLGRIRGIGLDQFNESYDLVINGTSVHLSKDSISLPSQIISADTCAYDMAYASEPTAFVQWSGSLGAKTSDGLGMLVCQAAESFQIWRGVLPGVKQLITELRESLGS